MPLVLTTPTDPGTAAWTPGSGIGGLRITAIDTVFDPTTDTRIGCITAAIPIDVAFPAANSVPIGTAVEIKNINGINDVTVTPSGLDTVDLVAGVFSFLSDLGTGKTAALFVSDGVSNWLMFSNYVLPGSSSVSTKAPCRVGTTTAGGNVTLVGGAPDTLDTIALATGNRILVKNQTLPAENGIYVVQTLGTGADGTWVRSPDMDTSAEITGTTLVGVQEGTPFPGGNEDTFWFITTDGAITIGISPINWAPWGLQTGGAVFVFRPGGVAAGNVYTDFNDLYTASLLVQGPKILQFDDTFAAITIPVKATPGAYDFSDFVAVGPGDLVANVLFAPTAQSSAFFVESTNINYTGDGLGVPTVLLVDNVTHFVTLNNCSINTAGTATAPFFQVDGNGFPATLLHLTMQARSVFPGPAVQPAVDLINGGDAFLYAYTESVINDTTLANVAFCNFTVRNDASGVVSQTQAGILGFVTYTRIDDASRVLYTPAVPGNWTVPPDDVAEALDALVANGLSTLLRSSAISTVYVATDQAIVMDSTGPVTIDYALPAAAAVPAGKVIRVIKKVTAGDVTITPAGLDTILVVAGVFSYSTFFGAGTQPSVDFMSDGVSNWMLV